MTILSLGLLGLVLASTFVLYRPNAFSNLLEYPVWLVTGLLVPLSLLPGWVEWISWVLACTWDDKKGGGSYRLSKIEMFSNGIPSLPPGQELSTLLDQIPVRLEAGLPNRYEVEVSYDGPNGRRYTESQTLSLETHLGLTRIERKDVHDVAKALEEIKKEIKRWSAFGGGSGLRIVTEEDMRRRYERFFRDQSGGTDDDSKSEEKAPEADAA